MWSQNILKYLHTYEFICTLIKISKTRNCKIIQGPLITEVLGLYNALQYTSGPADGGGQGGAIAPPNIWHK